MSKKDINGCDFDPPKQETPSSCNDAVFVFRITPMANPVAERGVDVRARNTPYYYRQTCEIECTRDEFRTRCE
jgi:hypothetical protein